MHEQRVSAREGGKTGWGGGGGGETRRGSKPGPGGGGWGLAAPPFVLG